MVPSRAVVARSESPAKRAETSRKERWNRSALRSFSPRMDAPADSDDAPRESGVSFGASSCYARRVAGDEPAKRSFEDDLCGEVDVLYAFARRATGSAASAEDLVQETCTRALAAKASYREGTNLRAWLFRIMKNILVDEARRTKASPITGAAIADDAVAANEPLLYGDVEIDRLRHVVSRDIEAALMALGADARIIVLLDLEGLSEREIATAMDCPQGTVKSRLHRARAALRALLGGYAP